MARLALHSKLTSLASALVIAYAASLITYLLSLLGPMHNAEQGTLDWRFLFRGPVGEKPWEIALVTVDEEAELPYWAPVPRAHLAEVVRALSRSGAQLIGLDFHLDKHSFDARGDSLLRAAIQQAGNVVLASYLDADEQGEMVEIPPLPFFADVALDYGYATFFTDNSQESVREGKVASGVEGRHALSLGGCLYAHISGMSTGEIRQLPWSKRHQELPGWEHDYRQVIDYNGPPFQFYRRLDGEMLGGIAAFHSHQVVGLPVELGRRFFADRIVLLGSGLKDAPDLYRTPFFAEKYDFLRAFGVEIHAHFLHTLLSADKLSQAGFFLTGFLVLGAAFLAALVAVRLKPYWTFPLALVITGLVWALGFYLFQSRYLMLPLITPTVATCLACLLGLIYVGSTDGRQKNEVRDRFAPMVDKGQLQQILQQPETWSTDGEERIVSVLWVQMPERDYHASSARETVAFFQEAWEKLSAQIFKNGGAVFRYEEDGLGAVFGAPLGEKNHPLQAVLAAIDLAEAWQRFAKEGGGEGKLKLGGDTGRVFLGELGRGERLAYRVLGRPVGRARSLAQEQEVGEEIRISRELWQQVEEQIEVEIGSRDLESGWYRVTGKSASPPLGAAVLPDNPFWKYLGLDRRGDDSISEELLGRLALFADFNQRELRQLLPLLNHRTYQAQERVFAQGEVGSAMYIIQKGSIDILQEGKAGEPSRLLQRLGEGDFFGELALLSDVRRSAAGVAYEPSELLVLFQTDLYDLIEREPELGVRLIRSLSRIMGERLIRANEELVHRGARPKGEGEET
jgi:CRP/FNR family transcriptional regulator, cyclic AMP receptor protein